MQSKARKEQKNIKTMIGLATRDAAAYAPSGGVVSFDFFEMFRKKRATTRLAPLNFFSQKRSHSLEPSSFTAMQKSEILPSSCSARQAFFMPA